MPRKKRITHVYCSTDHHQHTERATWPEIGWHVDHDSIPIPDNCTYVRHSTRVTSNNGKNKHRVVVRRRTGDARIIEVGLEGGVEPRTMFWGKRHWLGVELTVEIECPQLGLSADETEDEVVEESDHE